MYLLDGKIGAGGKNVAGSRNRGWYKQNGYINK
jgi:hypothetical protein